MAISPSVMDINRFRSTLNLIAEAESVADLNYWVLLTMVHRISSEGKDAGQVVEELGLPVLETEIAYLSHYLSAFGIIEETDDYGQAAEELLGEVGQRWERRRERRRTRWKG